MSDLSPREVAASAVKIECGKANLSITKMIMLGFLAGAFIAFGAEAATVVAHDIPGVGLARLVSGMVFSTGSDDGCHRRRGTVYRECSDVPGRVRWRGYAH